MTELKELFKQWWDEKNYVEEDKEEINDVENQIREKIKEKYYRKVNKEMGKSSPGDILEKLLSGNLDYSDFLMSWINEKVNPVDQKIKNHMKMVSKQLSTDISKEVEFILFSKLVLLMGGLSSSDMKKKEKMFSLYRKL